jgi:purine-nucleoside phosphorylase
MSEHAPQIPRLEAAAAAVKKHTSLVPDVALVLGSGLGSFADELEGKTAIPYGEIPGMPQSNVVGHAGKLVLGTIEGARVVAMQGRVHLYEGHPPATVVHGVRTAIAAGVGTVVVTNACGGITQGLSVGQPVLISDHVNYTGVSPLTGPPPPEPYHSRFTDLTDAYSPRLRALVREIEPSIPECVYMGFHGPEYESPAEVRMARTLGADLVGMSTVLETIAARHLRAEVLGLSLVTNLAAGLATEEITGDHVVEIANAASARIGPLLRATLERLGPG